MISPVCFPLHNCLYSRSPIPVPVFSFPDSCFLIPDSRSIPDSFWLISDFWFLIFSFPDSCVIPDSRYPIPDSWFLFPQEIRNHEIRNQESGTRNWKQEIGYQERDETRNERWKTGIGKREAGPSDREPAHPYIRTPPPPNQSRKKSFPFSIRMKHPSLQMQKS